MQEEIDEEPSDEDQFEYDEKYEQQDDLDDLEEDYKENEEEDENDDIEALESSDEDVVVKPKRKKTQTSGKGKTTTNNKIDVCAYKEVIRYALTHGIDKYRRRKR